MSDDFDEDAYDDYFQGQHVGPIGDVVLDFTGGADDDIDWDDQMREFGSDPEDWEHV